VRFNDAVQVFVLPPRTADEADLAAAAAAVAGREGSHGLFEQGGGDDPVLSDYQLQLQQQHGQWVRNSGAKPLSRRAAAKLRREQAAAAAAAAAVAVITGEGAAGAAPGQDQQTAGDGKAGSSSSSSSRKKPVRKQRSGGSRTGSDFLGVSIADGGSIGGSDGMDLAAAAAAAAAAVAEDEESAPDLNFEGGGVGFSPWHSQRRMQYGVPLVKGSAEAERVERMLHVEVGALCE
jgi:hypothetical protein